MSERVADKAIDAWAVYEYREHPKGLYHTCFVDGYKEGYEQAEKDTIERARQLLYGYNKQMSEIFGAKAVLSCNQFTIDVERFCKKLIMEEE